MLADCVADIAVLRALLTLAFSEILPTILFPPKMVGVPARPRPRIRLEIRGAVLSLCAVNLTEWQIPSTLAGLLEAARLDMLEIEKDPRFRIEFGAVLDTTRSEMPPGIKCELDLAGAVLVKRFGYPTSEELKVDGLPPYLFKLTGCLDALAQGFVGRSAAFFRDAIRLQQRVKYEQVKVAFGVVCPRFDYSDPQIDKRHQAIMAAVSILRSHEL